MASWNEIKESVEKNGNLLTVTMEQLRDAHGTAKLGMHVRADISSALAGIGLGHGPLVQERHASRRHDRHGIDTRPAE